MLEPYNYSAQYAANLKAQIVKTILVVSIYYLQYNLLQWSDVMGWSGMISIQDLQETLKKNEF